MAAEIKTALGVDAKITEGSKGIFDVIKDGKVVYSKATTGKFPDPGEAVTVLKS